MVIWLARTVGRPAVWAMASLAWAVTAAGADLQSLEVGRGERLLVVAPHPDDESLGAGGLIQRVLEHHGNVRVALMTAGDGYVAAVVGETGLPRPTPSVYVAYGERRLREARAAVGIYGKGVRLQFLGFPDGGLAKLLNAHWQRGRPERSRTTRASDPPYIEALEPDVAYDGSDLRDELVRILREVRPTIIALPDPHDVHPDHHATALFTLLALEKWVSESRVEARNRPRLLAYLVHWPAWPPSDPDASVTLPVQGRRPGTAPTALRLTDAELGKKAAALTRYASQQRVMGPFLNSFVRRVELFTPLTTDHAQRMARLAGRLALRVRGVVAPLSSVVH